MVEFFLLRLAESGQFEEVRQALPRLQRTDRQKGEANIWMLYCQCVAGAETDPKAALALGRDLLALDFFPKASDAHTYDVLSKTVESAHMLELLPLLHEKGWELEYKEGYAAPYILAKFLGNGKWPYPELFYPELLHYEEAVDKLGQALCHRFFYPNEVPTKITVEHLDRLNALPKSDNFSQIMEKSLASTACWATVDEELLSTEALLVHASSLGWFDFSRVCAQMSDPIADPDMMAFLSSLAARQLDNKTNPAHSMTPRLRF